MLGGEHAAGMRGARENRSESTSEARETVGGAKGGLDKAQVIERFKAVDKDTATLLYGICGRLGHLPVAPSSAKYILSVDHQDALRDLTRLLAAEEGQILVKLGELELVSRHLIPMLIVLVERGAVAPRETLVMVLDLIILFTSADVIASRASTPTLLDQRRRYKRAFEEGEAFAALLGVALMAISSARRECGGDAELLSKTFSIIRNLLAIPDATMAYASMNVSLASSFGRHERLVERMRTSRIVDFVIMAASSVLDERDAKIFAPHVDILVQIFQCLLCSTDPDAIAAASDAALGGPKKSLAEEALGRERRIRRPIRHGKFSGSLVVRLSTGEDYNLAGSRFRDPVTLDDGKRVQAKRKKISIDDFGDNAASVRSCEKRMIYEIARAFLTAALRPLAVFERENRDSFKGDETFAWNLLHLFSWCMRFARQLHLQGPPPAEASDVLALLDGVVDERRMCTYALLVRTYLEEKTDTIFLATLLFLRESLRVLDLMVNGAEGALKTRGRAIVVQVFHSHSFVTVFRFILQNFTRYSTRMASVALEANHVMLKLLQKYVAEKGHVFVSRASRPLRRVRASTNPDDDEEAASGDGEEDADEAYGEGILDEGEGSESEFFFDSLILEYATDAIIDFLVRLLRSATFSSSPGDVSTNRYVATMMVRLVGGVKVISPFCRVSFLDAAHQVLMASDAGWRRRNGDLIRVLQHISAAVLAKFEENPLMIVGAFFSSAVSNGGALRSHPLASSSAAAVEDHAQEERLQRMRAVEAAIPGEWSVEERITWLVRALFDAEQSTALSWLSGKLFDAAAARAIARGAGDGDDNGGEAEAGTGQRPVYYLHSQTASLKAAMQDAHFSTLMMTLGVAAPSSADPSWRLPSSVGGDVILERASLLRSAIDACNRSDAAVAVPDYSAHAQTMESAHRRAKKNPAIALSSEPDAISSSEASADESDCPSLSEAESLLSEGGGDDRGTLPAGAASRASVGAAPASGRWETLRRTNFFLSLPSDAAAERGGAPSVDGDNGEVAAHPRQRRLPIAIESESDAD